jgi:hypothetical protein
MLIRIRRHAKLIFDSTILKYPKRQKRSDPVIYFVSGITVAKVCYPDKKNAIPHLVLINLIMLGAPEARYGR